MERRWYSSLKRPFRSLWDLEGVHASFIVKLTWNAIWTDRLFGRAAELAFYFLFALFPTLFSASSILGLVAQSASHYYDKILAYLALVIPTQALGTVLLTFNETTAHATRGKLTFGLVAAIWSASVGVSAIQDSLNTVYKVQESRSFFVARFYAIALTVVLAIIVTLVLSAMLGGDFMARIASLRIHNPFLVVITGIAVRAVGWLIALALLSLSFAVIYYWAPDVKVRRWRWLTPGSAFGILGWLVASLGLRVYLSFFDSYSITYGSLGAVITLLTWFYITGLMILVGAEINSEIEIAASGKGISKST